jgi:16S rRNA (cytosine1402-N4)-methyltransferase
MSRSLSPRAGEHHAVLAQSAVDYLLTDCDGIYVDATFGRGGHSRLILKRLGPNGKLVAFDRDPQAVDAAGSIADPRFHVEHTPFSQLRVTLNALSITQVQ